MPYTEDFKKIRRHFSNLYDDKARADTFAFKKAFENNIKTFEDRKRRFKIQNKSQFGI